MPANIIYRTIGGSQEAAASITADTWGRTLTIPGGWNSIRIGMRWHTTDSGATLTIPDPNFYFGMQHGVSPTNLPGTTSTTNWIGMLTTGPWTRAANGGNPTYNLTDNSKFGFATKVGTVLTPQYWTYDLQQRFSVGAGAASNAADRSGVFLEIVKGSPNFQIRACVYGDTNSSIVDDLSQAEFLSRMLLPDPSIFARYAYLPGVDGPPAYFNLPFSESNGVLDTISFWWSDGRAAIEICDLAAVILS